MIYHFDEKLSKKTRLNPLNDIYSAQVSNDIDTVCKILKEGHYFILKLLADKQIIIDRTIKDICFLELELFKELKVLNIYIGIIVKNINDLSLTDCLNTTIADYIIDSVCKDHMECIDSTAYTISCLTYQKHESYYLPNYNETSSATKDIKEIKDFYVRIKKNYSFVIIKDIKITSEKNKNVNYGNRLIYIAIAFQSILVLGIIAIIYKYIQAS